MSETKRNPLESENQRNTYTPSDWQANVRLIIQYLQCVTPVTLISRPYVRKSEVSSSC